MADAIVAAYRMAGRRTLLLDYDGSLVKYASRPELATPPDELKSILRALVDSRRNSVMVISGRRRADLTEWFGDVPGLWLAAEHGSLIRPAGSAEWRQLRPQMSRDWMDRVIPVLEHFVERTPGSFIEEKEYSLVWHYRLVGVEVCRMAGA